jgi:hypothetical protein
MKKHSLEESRPDSPISRPSKPVTRQSYSRAPVDGDAPNYAECGDQDMRACDAAMIRSRNYSHSTYMYRLRPRRWELHWLGGDDLSGGKELDGREIVAS